MTKLVAFAAAVLGVVASASAEPFRMTLISSERNINLPDVEVNGKTVTPSSPAPWSVRKYALHGGKQEGVDVILLNNGRMQMLIVPTRGMGIAYVQLGDVRLGWDSPVKEIVNPQFINLSSRGGLGWLEGFNECIVRCGMEFNGHPGTDKFINNVGEEATMELTLHGRVENLPAQEVELVVDREAPYRIHVRGRVDERMFYGPRLQLWTELSTEPMSGAFRISDVISNEGAAEQEFQMLYHCNFGRPLLEEGSTFLGAAERVTPFNANAAKGIGQYTKYAGPTLGFIEQVYCIRPFTDAEGRTTAMLQNRAGDRGVSLSWSPKELPYLTLWKNTAAEKDGYVTGIEPGTGYPHNRRLERKAGRVPKLAAGASRTMSIDFAIHVGADEVKKAADAVRQVQGERKTTLDEQPEKLE